MSDCRRYARHDRSPGLSADILATGSRRGVRESPPSLYSVASDRLSRMWPLAGRVVGGGARLPRGAWQRRVISSDSA